jgi:hypothetical protein
MLSWEAYPSCNRKPSCFLRRLLRRVLCIFVFGVFACEGTWAQIMMAAVAERTGKGTLRKRDTKVIRDGNGN